MCSLALQSGLTLSESPTGLAKLSASLLLKPRMKVLVFAMIMLQMGWLLQLGQAGGWSVALRKRQTEEEC